MAKAGTGIALTGHKELDAKLRGMHGRFQKKLSRKATRAAAKEIVLPEAKAMAPIDTGALEKSLAVRAMKRSRTRIGHLVQTRDGFFQGEQFYGAFHEFGTRKMKADPFMRPAVYGNEQRIRAKYIAALQEAIREEEVKGAKLYR